MKMFNDGKVCMDDTKSLKRSTRQHCDCTWADVGGAARELTSPFQVSIDLKFLDTGALINQAPSFEFVAPNSTRFSFGFRRFRLN